MEYNSQSILLYGKPHRYKKLCNVPINYLLELYKIREHQITDKKLVKFLEDNYENFLNAEGPTLGNNDDRKLGYKVQGRRPVVTCPKTNKIIFATESIAKGELRRIRNLPQTNKKPVRVYECEYCGGWHLTSKPHSKFK